MAENAKLKAIAQKVLDKANLKTDENFGAVIMILMIISISLTLVRVLQECNKNKTQNMTATDKSVVYGESIRSFSHKRGWFTRMRIKRALKKELSPEEYNKYGISLMEAILDVGENLTDDEVNTLVEAANV